jgi:hypothetical protein
MSTFKPQLLPNNKAGIIPNWEERIEFPEDWLYSYKYDGCRTELRFEEETLGRSLKLVGSKNIQEMHNEFDFNHGRYGGVLEAEFFSPNMNFPEISHFFKTQDIESEHTRVKYEKLWAKTKGDTVWILGGVEHPVGSLFGEDKKKAIMWSYPGRSVEWLTTWQPCLKFYVFDYYLQDTLNKAQRSEMYHDMVNDAESDNMFPIQQNSFTHLDNLYQAYDQSQLDNVEGLIVMHKDSLYKHGRHTLNAKQGFKIKADNEKFSGVILYVEEATMAREGAEKTINELGRSRTSQLKEDRVLSGLAKGFKVKLDDGNEMTVSLNGFDNTDKADLLYGRKDWIGQRITFTAMSPVKTGGCPRGPAHYTKQ